MTIMDTYVQCPYCMGYNTHKVPMYKTLTGEIEIVAPSCIKVLSGINSKPRKWNQIVDEGQFNFLGFCESCQAKFVMQEKLIIRIGSELPESNPDVFLMQIDEIFSINMPNAAFPNMSVATGKISSGKIQMGDSVRIDSGLYSIEAVVLEIEMFRRILPCAEVGDNCGILLNVSKDRIRQGDILRNK